MNGKSVLCIGLVCVDNVSVCRAYPKEDTDQRCIDQYIVRGGNASNNCTILVQLGVKCEFLGVITNDWPSKYLQADFQESGIEANYIVHDKCETPLSSVIINSENGSRTILHCKKNLPEVSFSDFEKLSLAKFCWVHFEGRSRNVDHIKKMADAVRQYNLTSADVGIKISVEVEKPYDELTPLLHIGDIVFVGKDYAVYKGFTTMEEAAKGLHKSCRPSATIICPWGANGASACTADGLVVSCPAVKPACVIDTLGAGDTFIAACISHLCKGEPVLRVLEFGCKIAGKKCGHMGLRGIL